MSPSALAAAAFALTVVTLSSGWLALRDHAAAARGRALFSGTGYISDADRTSTYSVAEDGLRRFPWLVAPPGVKAPDRAVQRLELAFRADPGYGVRVRLRQFENSRDDPPRLSLTLDGGSPVTIPTRAGGGMDPGLIEHGAVGIYEVTLPGKTRPVRNVVSLEAQGGAWIALESVEIELVVQGGPLQQWRLWMTLATTAWAGLAACALRGTWRTRTSGRAWLAALGRRVLLVGLAGCAAVALGEVVVRLAAKGSPALRQLLYQPYESFAEGREPILEKLARHRCAPEPCGLAEGGFRLNRHGFFAPDYVTAKRPGLLRVVGIGDSFMAYGGPVPWPEQLFPRLEREVRRRLGAAQLEFIDLGFSCLGVPTEVEILRGEALSLDPDTIVWTLYLGNDLTDEEDADDTAAMQPQRPVRSMLWRLARRFARLLRDEPQRFFALARHQETKPTQRRCGVFEPEHAEPYDLANQSMSDASFRDYTLRRVDGVYRRRQRDRVVRLSEKLLRRMQRARPLLAGRTALIVLIPDEIQISPSALLPAQVLDPTLHPGDVDLDLGTGLVRAGLEAAGFKVLDLLPAFRQAHRLGASLYAPNDGHLSTAGTALTAAAIERRLAAMGAPERRR